MTIDDQDAGVGARSVVVVGGSAGSFEPLRALIRDLPADLPAAVMVTIHIGEHSRMSTILDRIGPLPAIQAEDGERMVDGRIYVAPPGRHLLVAGDEDRPIVRLSSGPRVNRHRPAVDVLLASAADRVAHVVAVVLSGVLDDGAVGAALVAREGGHVLVQDPDEAEFRGMPAAALAAAPGARSVPSRELAVAVEHSIQELTRTPARAGSVVGSEGGSEESMSMSNSGPRFLSDEESGLTRITCPECGGGMAEVGLPQITYFRCHVGHQYSPQTLAVAQAEASEAKLWSAVAALEEQAAVQHYLQEQRRGGFGSDDLRLDPQQLADRAASLRDQVRSWSGPPIVRDADPELA